MVERKSGAEEISGPEEFASKFVNMNLKLAYVKGMANVLRCREHSDTPAIREIDEQIQTLYKDIVTLTSKEFLNTPPQERGIFLTEVARLEYSLSQDRQRKPEKTENLSFRGDVVLKALELKDLRETT